MSLAESGLSPSAPGRLDRLLPGEGSWEVEIGFGKGRYLLERAAADPASRFLGIEMAAKYFRLVEHRAERRGLGNVLLLLGEALYIAAAVLPRRFAGAVHLYFPDPWPKDRHHKRRLLDHDSVDLMLGLLEPGGELHFASDHADYADQVEGILASHPALELQRLARWPDGARTNYEAKYERQGREIRRLIARLPAGEVALVHPAGRRDLLVAPAAAREASA